MCEECIPATVLEECLHDSIPVITKLVYMSIMDAVVPYILKNASLSLRLKKASLNPRNHQFSSHLEPDIHLAMCEKVVATQLCHQVEDDHLYEIYSLPINNRLM